MLRRPSRLPDMAALQGLPSTLAGPKTLSTGENLHADFNQRALAKQGGEAPSRLRSARESRPIGPFHGRIHHRDCKMYACVCAAIPRTHTYIYNIMQYHVHVSMFHAMSHILPNLHIHIYIYIHSYTYTCILYIYIYIGSTSKYRGI